MGLFDNDTQGNNGFDVNGFSTDGLDSDGFDDNDTGFGDMFSGGQVGDGGFDSDGGDFDLTQNNQQPGRKTTKAGIIALAVGIAGVLAVILIAGAVSKGSKEEGSGNTQQTTQTRVSQRVDGIMGENADEREPVIEQSNSNVSNKNNDNEGWVSIGNNEVIEFSTEYKSLIFLITDIEHYAKAVDSNSNLVVKTTLTGSLSGLSGTYTLDVPYSKGSRLVIGDEFAVKVQFGTFGGKKVIGEICY